ncbi:MAG: hypothetical protein LIO79_08175 [Rikenellaceae bacterium]|nr:hypothetical protein [Rikenellaceae bacterium]
METLDPFEENGSTAGSSAQPDGTIGNQSLRKFLRNNENPSSEVKEYRYGSLPHQIAKQPQH